MTTKPSLGKGPAVLQGPPEDKPEPAMDCSVSCATSAPKNPHSSVHPYEHAQDRSPTVSAPASPSVEKISELGGWPGGFDYCAFKPQQITPTHALWDIKPVLEQFVRLRHGVKMLPGNVMYDQDLRSLGDPALFEPHIYGPVESDQTLKIPTVAQVKGIVQATDSCILRQESKPGWNTGVQHDVLRLALGSSQWEANLGIVNVSTAVIEPPDLLQLSVCERHSTHGADFAVVLEPSAALVAGYRRINRYDDHSFNQSRLNTILDRPIALSVKTKASDGDGQYARLQLAIWAGAQLEQLKMLTRWTATVTGNEPAMLPPLPLVVVDGPRWSLVVATASPGTPRVTIWECGSFGETSDPVGVYKVCAVLQLLMQWSQETYRLWFETSALPLTPLERTRAAMDRKT